MIGLLRFIKKFEYEKAVAEEGDAERGSPGLSLEVPVWRVGLGLYSCGRA